VRKVDGRIRIAKPANGRVRATLWVTSLMVVKSSIALSIRGRDKMNESDIRQWVEQNAEGLMPETQFTLGELDHIAMCMHHIYRWYHEDYPIGDFLTAVVRNDLCEACYKADDMNRKALYLYALFLANKLPFDYREKSRPVSK